MKGDSTNNNPMSEYVETERGTRQYMQHIIAASAINRFASNGLMTGNMCPSSK
ncbi:hypothetical protein AGMMS49941_08260 [Deferribacterales bacterium]|nr:hypothetical protein AGMMS49941_08260 [Deferribacterales bacterium]